MTPNLKKEPTTVVFQGLEAGLRMFRWVVVVLLILFLVSGIQNVPPDQIGLLLRFGKLNGTTRADQVKQPGLLLALPYPIDDVTQVPVKQEGEVVIKDAWKEMEDSPALDAINPIAEGYCLTGDQNIIQTQVVVKYRIADPVAFRLYVEEPEVILHDVVLASLTRTIAGWKVDDVLRLQRTQGEAGPSVESLSATVWNRAQQRLDELDCGVTISALEFKEIYPPRHVIKEFRAVQSAKIEMETKRRDAEGFAAREVLKGESERNRLVREAEAYENTSKARASAEYSVFEQLCAEYRKNSALVWNRIYLETMEQVLKSVGRLDFVSPEDRVILSNQEESSE